MVKDSDSPFSMQAKSNNITESVNNATNSANANNAQEVIDPSKGLSNEENLILEALDKDIII